MRLELGTTNGKDFHLLKDGVMVKKYEHQFLYTGYKDLEELANDLRSIIELPTYISVDGIHGRFIYISDGRWADTVIGAGYNGESEYSDMHSDAVTDYYKLMAECLARDYKFDLNLKPVGVCPEDIDPAEYYLSFLNIENSRDRLLEIRKHVGSI